MKRHLPSIGFAGALLAIIAISISSFYFGKRLLPKTDRSDTETLYQEKIARFVELNAKRPDRITELLYSYEAETRARIEMQSNIAYASFSLAVANIGIAILLIIVWLSIQNQKSEQVGPDNTRSCRTSVTTDAGASAPPEASGASDRRRV